MKTLNSHGLSLIEVMVSLAIGSIVMMAFTSMMSSQQSQLRAVSQKLELLSLETIMLKEFSKSDVCTWQLAGKLVDLRGSLTVTRPSPTILQLAQLHQGLDAASPILVQSGSLLPGSPDNVRVDSIEFRDIYPTGSPNEYRGTLQVNFNAQSLVYAMQPARLSQIITVDATNPGSAKIVSCATSQSSSGLSEACGERQATCDLPPDEVGDPPTRPWNARYGPINVKCNGIELSAICRWNSTRSVGGVEGQQNVEFTGCPAGYHPILTTKFVGYGGLKIGSPNYYDSMSCYKY